MPSFQRYSVAIRLLPPLDVQSVPAGLAVAPTMQKKRPVLLLHPLSSSLLLDVLSVRLILLLAVMPSSVLVLMNASCPVLYVVLPLASSISLVSILLTASFDAIRIK